MKVGKKNTYHENLNWLLWKDSSLDFCFALFLKLLLKLVWARRIVKDLVEEIIKI